MISKEGVIFAVIFFIAALFTQHYTTAVLSLPFWLLFAVVFYLFRDPAREIPSMPLAILSPADGKVTAVETTHDPYINRSAIKISISMSPLGIYTTRSPTEGKIVQRWFKGPSKESSSSDKDKEKNRRGSSNKRNFGIWIQTDEQDDVVLVMQPHSFLNAPRCYVQSGERIGQGRRCGYIRFGSKLELYMPENSKVDVKPGDTIVAGTSILASLIHCGEVINENLING